VIFFSFFGTGKRNVSDKFLGKYGVYENLIAFEFLRKRFYFCWKCSGKSLFSWGAGYQASKFALRGFVGSLRKELGGRCFLINPKIVETDFHKNNQIAISGYKKTALEDIIWQFKIFFDGKSDSWEIDL
jgi:NAD(P)-dependent dehydrogenase (short-subunit alcohol dehydrogenase family)